MTRAAGNGGILRRTKEILDLIDAGLRTHGARSAGLSGSAGPDEFVSWRMVRWRIGERGFDRVAREGPFRLSVCISLELFSGPDSVMIYNCEDMRTCPYCSVVVSSAQMARHLTEKSLTYFFNFVVQFSRTVNGTRELS